MNRGEAKSKPIMHTGVILVSVGLSLVAKRAFVVSAGRDQVRSTKRKNL